MFTFLHLADVHLDTAFDGRTTDLRARMRQSLRTAFRRAVDLAIDEAVDAVLIAGDLFDDERLSFATEVFLVDQCQRLADAGIACIYATGNHDPGGSGFRAGQIDWPDNVRYVDSPQPVTFELSGPNGAPRARVTAAGHASAREGDNLAARFPTAADDGVVHVGLLHAHVTSATGVDRHDRYAPCTADDLRASGYDYWALGHIHNRQQVDADAHAWYAGSLQGRSPRETGPRGGLLVRVEPGRAPSVRFVDLAPVRWEQVVLGDLDDVATVSELQAEVREALDRLRDADDAQPRSSGAPREWLVRLRLTGPSPLADELASTDDVFELESVLADRLDLLDVEIRTGDLTPPVDVDAFRGETHLAGEVLDLIDRAVSDDDVLDEVTPEVLASVSGESEEECRDALRSMLHDMDRRAISRLVSWYAD